MQPHWSAFAFSLNWLAGEGEKNYFFFLLGSIQGAELRFRFKLEVVVVVGRFAEYVNEYGRQIVALIPSSWLRTKISKKKFEKKKFPTFEQFCYCSNGTKIACVSTNNILFVCVPFFASVLLRSKVCVSSLSSFNSGLFLLVKGLFLVHDSLQYHDLVLAFECMNVRT